MKKINMLTVILLLVSFQSITAQSLLWKVDGNGLTQPSYLYGTIHAVCPHEVNIDTLMKTAIASSEQLAFELNFGEENIGTKMQAEILMKDNLTIKDLVSAEAYEILDQYFNDSLQMPLSSFERMNPVFLGTMAWMSVLDCLPTSYEIELTNYAISNGKAILGIETLEEQLSYFDSIPLKKQAEYLVMSISNIEERNEEIILLNNAYADADIQALYETAYKGLKKLENGEYYLMELRNHKWIPRVESMINEKSTFIAVGAGHLGGMTGLINLLRNKGYKVTPVLESTLK